jgi:hypothetical protein
MSSGMKANRFGSGKHRGWGGGFMEYEDAAQIIYLHPLAS